MPQILAEHYIGSFLKELLIFGGTFYVTLNLNLILAVRFYLLTLFLTIWLSDVYSQNFESIKDAPPLKFSGSLNATGIGYAIDGLAARRDPFNWFLTGNVNFDIYGWSVPLSFSYSNQNVAFRQPFNQYGISPTYKWAKAYIGYHNLTYSSYTLAGHVFLGSALELTPGKFRFHAMYGRLNKAVEEDTILNTLPSFKRMGFAIKTGYGDNGNSIDLIMFSAADDINSLSYVPEKTDVLPKENLVLSLVGKKKITERIFVLGEWASSAITRDTRAEANQSGSPAIFSRTGGLFTPRATSEYYDAFKTSLGYNGNFYTLQMTYERIDPGYQTLGAYFFNNDMENITASTSVKLFENKLDLSGNFGTQRNNLNDTEVSAVKRVIGAVNVNYIPNEKWNVGGSYSNFTTFTNVRPRFDPFFANDLDTLNFYQLNQNATTSIAYSFGNKQIKKGIYFNGSYQLANEVAQRDTIPSNSSQFYSGNLAYRYSVIPGNWSASIAINVNRNDLAGTESLTIGPNLMVTKAFLQKKLRCSFSSSYNQVRNNAVPASSILNMRLNGNYSVNKKHVISLNLVTLRKFAIAEGQTGFTEFTATANYGFNF